METNDLIWVTDAHYLNGYKIALTFNNGVIKTVDLQHRLSGQVFEPLADIENFKLFEISDWTIEWKNGADFAPEYLYEIGV